MSLNIESRVGHKVVNQFARKRVDQAFPEMAIAVLLRRLIDRKNKTNTRTPTQLYNDCSK